MIFCDLYTRQIHNRKIARAAGQRWYHILMKLFGALSSITVFAAATFASVNPQLLQVKKIYILAMGSGMDQYLANQLTQAGIFEVVTDPKKADAILTDSVGEQFQKKLDDLYAPPKPAPDATKPAANFTNSLDVGDNTPSNTTQSKNLLEGVDFSGGGTRSSSFGRNKGNYFVVDRNSRIVLWSVYNRSKNTTSGELTKTAVRVVKQLKEDLTPKKPAE